MNHSKTKAQTKKSLTTKTTQNVKQIHQFFAYTISFQTPCILYYIGFILSYNVAGDTFASEHEINFGRKKLHKISVSNLILCFYKYTV